LRFIFSILTQTLLKAVKRNAVTLPDHLFRIGSTSKDEGNLLMNRREGFGEFYEVSCVISK